MQLCLAFAGLFLFILLFLVLPETSHPGTRGIDKLRLTGDTKNSWKHVNPIRPAYLLRSTTVCTVSIASFFIVVTSYILLIPLAYTIGEHYHLNHNEAYVGACFLPSGLGNMVGATVGGRISDRIIASKKKRKGVWYPEDRLRAAFPGALIFAPLSVLGCGLATQYVEGSVGLTLNLVCLFFNGVGISIVLSQIGAYVVDVLHSRSAEAMACNAGFRSFLLSLVIPAMMPMITNYGFLFTTIIASAFGWASFIILLITVRYGEQMRSWTNVEYSSVENN